MFVKQDIVYFCSKCGSKQIENFKNNVESGFRCLNCGHKKVDTTTALVKNGSISWALTGSRRMVSI